MNFYPVSPTGSMHIRGRVQPGFICSSVCLHRLSFATMDSTVAVHTNGLGSVFQFVRNSPIVWLTKRHYSCAMQRCGADGSVNEPEFNALPNGMTRLARERALVLFFFFAFAISWVLWFLEAGLRTKDGLAAGLLVKIATYGPVLSAMIVSALANPERVSAPRKLRWLTGGLILVLALYCQWPTSAQLRSNDGTPLGWALLAVSVLLPAWVVFNAHSGIRGVRELLRGLTRWRVHPLWFLTASFLMMALSLIGVLLTVLFTGQPLSHFASSIQSSPTFQHLGPTILATALYGGPLGEEGGWRAFALPRIQRRYDPLLASVILAAFWGLWHLPLHLTGYYREVFGSPLNGILQQMLSAVPLAIIFTWLYNRSRGSLLIMVLLHTAINVTSGMVTPSIGLFISTTLAVALIVVMDRMYRKQSVKEPKALELAAHC